MAKTKYYYYKNTSENDLSLVGYGMIKSGETIKLEEEVFNPNLKLTTAKEAEKESGDTEDSEE